MAETLTWRIAGRNPHAIPPADWRDRLAARLGQRPRRLGLHTELALFGALEALAAASETSLPASDLVRVCSARGPVTAVATVLEQSSEDLPLPFAFLQSQPSQMLAALASALKWQGDASFMVTRDPLMLLTLALHQAGPRGLLIGWVDESPLVSEWLRLVPCDAPQQAFAAATEFAPLIGAAAGWLQLTDGRLSFA